MKELYRMYVKQKTDVPKDKYKKIHEYYWINDKPHILFIQYT